MEVSPLVQVARAYIDETIPCFPENIKEMGLMIIKQMIEGTRAPDVALFDYQRLTGSTEAINRIKLIIEIKGNDGGTSKKSKKSEKSSTQKVIDDIIITKKKNNNRSNYDDKSSYLQHPERNKMSGRCVARNWTTEEDMRLLAGIHRYGIDDWVSVSKFVGNFRTKPQCSQRWYRGLNPSIIKGPWTVEEEKRLSELVNKYGDKAWKQIASIMKTRSDAQCRYHYGQMMKPNLSEDQFLTNEELSSETQLSSIESPSRSCFDEMFEKVDNSLSHILDSEIEKMFNISDADWEINPTQVNDSLFFFKSS